MLTIIGSKQTNISPLIMIGDVFAYVFLLWHTKLKINKKVSIIRYKLLQKHVEYF